MPDQALDPLRGARLPGLQGRDGEALPRLHGDLPERQRRRGAAAAAVQLGDHPGRQGDRARPGQLRRRRLAGASSPRARTSRSSPTTARSPTCRPTTTSPSTTRASARRSPRAWCSTSRPRACAKDTGGVLQINGSPTDAAAGLIRDGIHEGLGASGYKTLAEFDTPDWAPAKAQEWTSGQIQRFGEEIVGVVAANDGTGGGAIAAFKAAGVDPVPAGDRQRRDDRRAAAHHRGRPVQHHLQALRDRGGRRGQRRRAVPRTARRRSRRPTLYDTPSRALRPGGGDRARTSRPRSSTRASTPPRRSAPAATPRAARSSASSRPHLRRPAPRRRAASLASRLGRTAPA